MKGKPCTAKHPCIENQVGLGFLRKSLLLSYKPEKKQGECVGTLRASTGL